LRAFTRFLLLLAGSVLPIGPSLAQSADATPWTRETSIEAGLGAPTAVALDADENLYVSESSRNRVLVYNSSGRYLRKLDGLAKPLGIAVGGDGRMYVCNAGSGNVSVYSGALTLLRKLGAGNGEFRFPVAVAVGNSGNIYVVDGKGNTVKVYRPDGMFLFSFGSRGNDDGNFNFPTSIAIDAGTGDIVVSDMQTTQTGIGGARIQVFDANGAFKRKFGSFGQGEGFLMKPLGMAVDRAGRIYVSDAGQNIVHVFDGSGNYQGSVYDLGRPFRTPLGMAVSGRTGKLYVASLNTSTVEVYGGGTVPGGKGTLTFSRSGGGGCSVVVDPPGASSSPWGSLIPLIVVSLYLLARKHAAADRRNDRHAAKP